MKYIPEPDLYRLIMASKQPDAVKFQDWVCEVVLPQIHKTGISMAQMAKLITQNGHRIGRTQLYQTLRGLGYIFKNL